jgi:polyisoprenyl-phosphate glycosyltransferase
MARLSLVIPCYNEAGNLANLVQRIAGAMGGGEVEVILVDNGSNDETPAVMAREIAPYSFIRSTRVEVNQGYGFGILAGLKVATSDILAWTHADLQTDPADVFEGMALFDNAPDPANLFVKGARHSRPLRDVVFTWGMTLFESLLLGVHMPDINAQPTMFHRRFFATWNDAPHDFALDLYAYYKAARNGLHIARFPVRFETRTAGVGNNETLAAKFKNSKRAIQFSFGLRRKLRATMK